MANHFLMSDSDGTSALEATPAPEFAAADYAGWEALSVEAANLFFFMFRVAPDAAEYPLHASPDEWLAYVVSGGGTLCSGNAAGDRLGQVSFAAGDLITFKPNTQHGWKNGNEQTKILFVKVL